MKKQLRHWTQLPHNEQIDFWQRVDAGDNPSYLVPVETRKTRRQRGEHSTCPKCESPSWYRPLRYKRLPGQLGHAYNRLVTKNPETGLPALRLHMSRHPFYIQRRICAGRKNQFKPEKALLLDATWPLLISFCDAGTHTVGMCISRLARELSPKDSTGAVIPETEVTVSRVSRLIEEQVRFGTLGVSSEKMFDPETRTWLPKYVWITDVGFSMLGIDLIKLGKEQEKALRESRLRRELIEAGIMQEWEEISPHAARKRHAEKMTLQALRLRREKASLSKRARRLAPLPQDARIQAMSEHIRRTMPPDEAFFASSHDRLEKLAIQQLALMERYLSDSPPD
ncbi:replication initiation protein [Enterobacter mori]|uniref:plasmid replication initiator RepA n=1 Tax=Enterobacter mori TaxID=539813 RepID=UPI001BE0C5DC|nr:plasmid replication initiator RepA [Enterobacter mori]MBT1872785.1 replication initiation protein [Enterobacter mori]HCM9655482.1 replication initiation protein [Enterobacter kobei]